MTLKLSPPKTSAEWISRWNHALEHQLIIEIDFLLHEDFHSLVQFGTSDHYDFRLVCSYPSLTSSLLPLLLNHSSAQLQYPNLSYDQINPPDTHIKTLSFQLAGLCRNLDAMKMLTQDPQEPPLDLLPEHSGRFQLFLMIQDNPLILEWIFTELALKPGYEYFHDFNLLDELNNQPQFLRITPIIRSYIENHYLQNLCNHSYEKNLKSQRL